MAFSATLVDSSGPNNRIYDCTFGLDADTTGIVADIATWSTEYVVIQATEAGGPVYTGELFSTIDKNKVTFTKNNAAGSAGSFRVTFSRSDKA